MHPPSLEEDQHFRSADPPPFDGGGSAHGIDGAYTAPPPSSPCHEQEGHLYSLDTKARTAQFLLVSIFLFLFVIKTKCVLLLSFHLVRLYGFFRLFIHSGFWIICVILVF